MSLFSKSETIREFQHKFNVAYPNSDLSEDYIFAYLSRTVSYLCKSLSQEGDSINAFIETTSWLMSLANKFEVDLQESLLKRYPGVCHYCISIPCICHKTGKQPKSSLPLFKVAEELEARYRYSAAIETVSLDWMSELIESIYPNNEIIWRSAGPWRHLMKMQEEVGEIHEAYTGYLSGRKSKSELSNEFADAFGWVLAAWAISHKGISLSDSLKDYYIKGCPVCLKEVCVCAPRAGRSKELLDQVKLKELKLQISQLAEVYPRFQNIFDDLDMSFKTAIQAEDEGLRRQVILKAKEGLSDIFEKTGKASKNANALFKTLETLASIMGLN